MTKRKNKIKKENILFVGETKKIKYFFVKGNKIYSVLYLKDKGTFFCSCNNVRNNECYHIKAVKMFYNNILK